MLHPMYVDSCIYVSALVISTGSSAFTPSSLCIFQLSLFPLEVWPILHPLCVFFSSRYFHWKFSLCSILFVYFSALVISTGSSAYTPSSLCIFQLSLFPLEVRPILHPVCIFFSSRYFHWKFGLYSILFVYLSARVISIGSSACILSCLYMFQLSLFPLEVRPILHPVCTGRCAAFLHCLFHHRKPQVW